MPEYFYHRAIKRTENDGDNAQFTECEELGKRVHLERKQAIESWANKKKEAKKAKEDAMNQKRMAEEYLGAVPESQGVSAPSGLNVTANIQKGLEALGKQTSSRNCM